MFLVFQQAFGPLLQPSITYHHVCIAWPVCCSGNALARPRTPSMRLQVIRTASMRLKVVDEEDEPKKGPKKKKAKARRKRSAVRRRR